MRHFGAVAVALAAAHQLQWPSPISVQTSSKQELLIEFRQHDKTYTDVTLTGPATHSFDGTIIYHTRVGFAHSTSAKAPAVERSQVGP